MKKNLQPQEELPPSVAAEVTDDGSVANSNGQPNANSRPEPAPIVAAGEGAAPPPSARPNRRNMFDMARLEHETLSELRERAK